MDGPNRQDRCFNILDVRASDRLRCKRIYSTSYSCNSDHRDSDLACFAFDACQIVFFFFLGSVGVQCSSVPAKTPSFYFKTNI